MNCFQKLLLCIFSCTALLNNIYAGPQNVAAFSGLRNRCLPTFRAVGTQDVERIITTFIRPMVAQTALMTGAERAEVVAPDIVLLQNAIRKAPHLPPAQQDILIAAVDRPATEEEIETARQALRQEVPASVPAAHNAIDVALARRRALCEEIRHETEELRAFMQRRTEDCEREAQTIQKRHECIIGASFDDPHTMLAAMEESITQSMDLLGHYLASYDQRRELVGTIRSLISTIQDHQHDDDFEVFIRQVIREVRVFVAHLFIDSKLLTEVFSCLEALQVILLDWAEAASTHMIDMRMLRDARDAMHNCIDGLLKNLIVVIMGTDESLAAGLPSPIPAFAWNLFRQSIENSQVLITAIVSDDTTDDRSLINDVIPCLLKLMLQSFARLEDLQHAETPSGDVYVTKGLFETFINFYVTAIGTIVTHLMQHTPWNETRPEDFDMYARNLFGGLRSLLITLNGYAHHPILGQLLETVNLPDVARVHFNVLGHLHDLDRQVLQQPRTSVIDFCRWLQFSHIHESLSECNAVYSRAIQAEVDRINRMLSMQVHDVRSIDTIDGLTLATIILLQNLRNPVATVLEHLHGQFDGTHFGNILEVRAQLHGLSPDEVITPFTYLLGRCGFDFTLHCTMDTTGDEEAARQLEAELNHRDG